MMYVLPPVAGIFAITALALLGELDVKTAAGYVVALALALLWPRPPTGPGANADAPGAAAPVPPTARLTAAIGTGAAVAWLL